MSVTPDRVHEAARPEQLVSFLTGAVYRNSPSVQINMLVAEFRRRVRELGQDGRTLLTNAVRVLRNMRLSGELAELRQEIIQKLKGELQEA